MFAGGGIELAERLIKDEAGFALTDEGDAGAPDLRGLSCRWEPCRSLRGRMLTLLVRSREADRLATHRQIIQALARILGDPADAAAPVRRETLRFVWPPAGLRAEAIATRGRLPWRLRWLYLMLETFLQLLAERFDLSIKDYRPPVYHEELRRNSDHRKVADTLHMVLDCTNAEATAIERYLAALPGAGRIVYGTHGPTGR